MYSTYAPNEIHDDPASPEEINAQVKAIMDKLAVEQAELDRQQLQLQQQEQQQQQESGLGGENQVKQD